MTAAATPRQPAGTLRGRRRRADGAPQGLGRPPPGPRGAHLSRRCATGAESSRSSSTARAARPTPSRPPRAPAARTSSRSRAASSLAARGSATRTSPTGEVEVVAARLAFLARSETPPFTVEDRTNATEELRLEYRYLDLRRPAMLKNFVLRDEIAFRVRRVLHERGLPRGRDADAHAVDSRGRARLPRAVPRAPRQVLRAAAVAAALQADPHGVGLREVLPDRALLPRRGPARRPPVRVHADRPRDVLPDRGGRLRHGRGVPRRGVRGGGDRARTGRSRA